MTGPKTNEGATKAGERVGTRCRVRYVRSSASKARLVLDLIRGKHVRDADEILQLTQRDIAHIIRKALASAVANAQNNDNQDPDELYVAACYADEGPTLKRFRPRARGRAGRIRKRTCHITIVVARMSDSALEQRRKREEARPQGGRRGRAPSQAAAARRARVARSRQAAAERAGHTHDHDHDQGEPAETVEVDQVEVDDITSDTVAEADDGAEQVRGETPDAATATPAGEAGDITIQGETSAADTATPTGAAGSVTEDK